MASSPSGRSVVFVVFAVGLMIVGFIGLGPVMIEDTTGPYADPKPVSCGPVWFPNLDKVSDAGVARCAALAGPRSVFAGALFLSCVIGLLATGLAPVPARRVSDRS